MGHTPGSWGNEWLDDENGWIMDTNSNYLAQIVTKDDEGFSVPLQEQKANARLMASAPEILDALIISAIELDHAADALSESNQQQADNCAQRAMEAREVIKQAEGRE